MNGSARSKGLRGGFIRLLTRLLTKEHHGYLQRFPNDLERLRRTLRPGDVVLVEGSQRISEVIKYLTKSSWSHATLYVGDALVQRGDRQAGELTELYGEEADTLLIEATIEKGVAAAPLSKYAHHNVRICRPINLRPGDLGSVVETIIVQMGTEYNIDHMIDLLRYFLPIRLMPQRWRRRSFVASRLTRSLICSSQIAMAFQKVRYPIQPAIDEPEIATTTPGVSSWATGARGIAGWLSGRKRAGGNVFATHVFTPCDPMVITPRDFDLSPYFEVVKFNVAGRKDFDYKKINWSEATATETPVEPATPVDPRTAVATAARD